MRYKIVYIVLIFIEIFSAFHLLSYQSDVSNSVHQIYFVLLPVASLVGIILGFIRIKKETKSCIILIIISFVILLLMYRALSSASEPRKGPDALIKSYMANSRAQAEIFYNLNKTYRNVCSMPQEQDGINTLVQNASNVTKSGIINTNLNFSETDSTSVCHEAEDGTAWATQVPLIGVNLISPNSYKDFYCVDSTGQSKVEDLPLEANSTTCH